MKISAMPEPDPCPFCGSDNVTTCETRLNPVATGWMVACVHGCDAEGPKHPDERGAIYLWNERPSIVPASRPPWFAPLMHKFKRVEMAKHLCAASGDDWSAGRAYWLSLADEILAIATRDSDGSGEADETGTDSARRATARAEGIAKPPVQP